MASRTTAPKGGPRAGGNGLLHRDRCGCGCFCVVHGSSTVLEKKHHQGVATGFMPVGQTVSCVLSESARLCGLFHPSHHRACGRTVPSKASWFGPGTTTAHEGRRSKPFGYHKEDEERLRTTMPHSDSIETPPQVTRLARSWRKQTLLRARFTMRNCGFGGSRNRKISAEETCGARQVTRFAPFPPGLYTETYQNQPPRSQPYNTCHSHRLLRLLYILHTETQHVWSSWPCSKLA